MDKRKAAENKFKELKIIAPDKRTTLDFVKFNVIDGIDEISIFGSATACSLSEANEKYPELVKKHLYSISYTENKFAAFNSAFWNQGAFVHVKKGQKAEVTILHKSSKSIATRTLIIAERESEVKILEKQASNVEFRSETVEIICEEEAKVSYVNIQNIPTGSDNYTIKKAKVAKDATLKWMDVCLGGKLVLSEMSNELAGKGARSKTLGLFFGQEKQHFDLNVATIHAETDTVSEMLTKGALKDRAKCVYRGLIHIKPNAARSNGFQKEDTLMLSEGAEVDPIPRLDIENNDVKCAHGAAITQIDESKLFYMASRGIDEDVARKLVVEGFFDSFIEEVGNEEIKTELKEIVKKRTA